jgi:hypothetical protein
MDLRVDGANTKGLRRRCEVHRVNTLCRGPNDALRPDCPPYRSTRTPPRRTHLRTSRYGNPGSRRHVGTQEDDDAARVTLATFGPPYEIYFTAYRRLARQTPCRAAGTMRRQQPDFLAISNRPRPQKAARAGRDNHRCCGVYCNTLDNWFVARGSGPSVCSPCASSEHPRRTAPSVARSPELLASTAWSTFIISLSGISRDRVLAVVRREPRRSITPQARMSAPAISRLPLGHLDASPNHSLGQKRPLKKLP